MEHQPVVKMKSPIVRFRLAMRSRPWARRVSKSVSWRVTGTLDTAILAYLFTQDFSVAAAIGGAELVTKTFLYVLHERAWDWLAFAPLGDSETQANL